MAVSLDTLLDDLLAETADVETMIAPLDDTDIARPTPAAGWTVRDQLTHLAFFDEAATQAAVDPSGFRAAATALMAAGMDFPDRVAAAHARLGADAVRAWFARARAAVVAAFRGRDPRARLPWYGPDMSVASSVTARIMETWAHGQDIADALGYSREPTDRLRHIAHLGVSTAGVQLRAPRPPAADRPDPGRAARPVRGALDLGCGRGRRPRRRLRAGLLPHGHPAPPCRRHRPRRARIRCARMDRHRPGVRRGARARPREDRRMSRPVRIANCSGFYGDRLAAAREMVDGGPVDVLTGDYLAELTMLILWKARQKDPATGYAKTFLTQLEQVLGTCLDRGIRIVSNAGGLNPSGLATEIAALAERLGLHPKIAHVDGDDLVGRLDELQAAGHDLTHLDTGRKLADAGVEPLTANAYLGGWGIAAALAADADVVVTGRVTDASLVVGPAAWWHGWTPADVDAIAGAMAAGHVIECGPQATGGNYAFFEEVTDRRYPGFPIAEVEADGSSVITKHADTGGLVSVGTVTAQLLYEIAEPAYAGPDAVAHFDTLRLDQQRPDRVRISGTRGSPPSDRLKVALNHHGGYRNTMTLVLTGLRIEEKAAWAERQLFDLLGGRDQFASVDVALLRFDHPDAPANAEATAHLRITVKDPDARKVGRRFANTTMELALGGYPGFHTTTPPTAESAFGVYWPTLVPAAEVEHRVTLPDGTRHVIPHPPTGPPAIRPSLAARVAPDFGPTRRLPLGTIAGARSGDKGGNANIGLWTHTDAEFAWLRTVLDERAFRALLPEAADLDVRRYELPNLRALNFVVVGILGAGVASATRPDPQAKGLGEYLRSRLVDIPESIIRT